MILYSMQSEHKKILIVMLLGIFLVVSVSALTYKQSTNFDINIVCINAGFCSASADCNVSVFDPKGIVLLDGIQATQSASLAFFNISLDSNQSSVLGEYQVGGFCKDGSVTQLVDFTFQVTPTGGDLDTGQSLIVLGLTILLLFLSGAFLFFGIKVETTSVKVFLIALGVLFFLLTLGFSVNTIKQLMQLGSVFSGTFVGLYRLFLVLVSGGMIAIILYLVTVSVTAFKKSRGILDEDD